jgi:tetratricopeptide (TPR) repeat protein
LIPQLKLAKMDGVILTAATDDAPSPILVEGAYAALRQKDTNKVESYLQILKAKSSSAAEIQTVNLLRFEHYKTQQNLESLLALTREWPGIDKTRLTQIAQLLSDNNRFKESQTLYQRALKQFNLNKLYPAQIDELRQVYLGLGDVNKRLKNRPVALDNYHLAWSLGPNGSLAQAIAGYEEAVMALELNKTSQALTRLESLVFPKDAGASKDLAQLKRGECLEKLNRFKDALTLYQKLNKSPHQDIRTESVSRSKWIEQNVPVELRR